ncbi:CLUMA_CG011564, isoform A [Clunio marinus]|uniref:CLUMA_CG011564, isoform A n=1 Tax=Clunio marinus TaxID=568069 RepID=A0A1J1IIB7_9DIPT|nr:CLUMA_CG011564, isoform A [Clunio marinus]
MKKLRFKKNLIKFLNKHVTNTERQSTHTFLAEYFLSFSRLGWAARQDETSIFGRGGVYEKKEHEWFFIMKYFDMYLLCDEPKKDFREVGRVEYEIERILKLHNSERFKALIKLSDFILYHLANKTFHKSLMLPHKTIFPINDQKDLKP